MHLKNILAYVETDVLLFLSSTWWPCLGVSLFLALLRSFVPVFQARSWQKLEVLLARDILALGQRTVTGILRVRGLARERRFVNYHRVLNRAA
jgi:hypothetical protein